MLTYSEILSIALDSSDEMWGEFSSGGENLIEDEHLYYHGAWMFFRKRELLIPDEASMKKSSIVISSDGEVRHTADFYPDIQECYTYLKLMAEHFKVRK